MRRAFSSAPSFIPVVFFAWSWYRLGEPAHRDGFYAVLGLGVLGAVLMPGIVVSVEALPMLLVPPRMRAWWRRGQSHRPAIRMYLKRAILAADRYQCCYCHQNFQLQIDHIKPWSRGGLSALWNLAVLCGRCNRIKSNYWPGGYYRAFPGSDNERMAAAILRRERWHRLRPDRWLRAGWSLAA